jgi:hypothetical protein
MAAPSTYHSSTAAFFGGVRSALASVFFLVIMGTYTGIGALAHDFGLSRRLTAALCRHAFVSHADVIFALDGAQRPKCL